MVVGRDSTRCKHSRQPTTAFHPGALLPLIGCGRRTDVSSLMIFVTIKLIVVYGSEMQECEGVGSRLMDLEVRELEGGVHGIKMRRGLADFGPTAVQTVVDVTRGMETGASHILCQGGTLTATLMQALPLCVPSKSWMRRPRQRGSYMMQERVSLSHNSRRTRPATRAMGCVRGGGGYNASASG